MTKTQACIDAGLSASNITNIQRKPGVRERMEFLTQQKTQALQERCGVSMSKDGLAQVLWLIVNTPAGQLTENSSICQKWEVLPGGTKVAMPDKISAGQLLARLMGWMEPEKQDVNVSGLDGIIRRVLKK